MANAIEKTTWLNFKLKNENPAKAFEDLCYHLFCRKYNQAEGIRIDYNQSGLETYPVRKANRLIGFQSKFFENKLSDRSSVIQIIDSVTKAKAAYPGLTTILIYTHQSFGASNPKYKVEIEKKAAPVKIEWILDSNFKTLLSKPANLDLVQLYFGVGNEIGFIKDAVNPVIFTLLQSPSYISLPIAESAAKTISDLKTEILKSSGKEFLIAGSPGCGKTILMQKLFQLFGGLDQTSESKMRQSLLAQGAVPMLVNLKHCASDSLENILRGRQTDNSLRGKKLGFIYIFDGLDELNELTVVQVLSYIHELSSNPTTVKIILSCRTGSLNRLRAKDYLKAIIDFTVLPLGLDHIDLYFSKKANRSRIEKIKSFKADNKNLLSEIKDILLLSIFWEVIEELPLNGTFIDLLKKKIDLLLSNPQHRNNIEELNLLNPKESQIISLNQDISFHFQKNFQFRFSQSELQKLIAKKFARLDYSSVNSVLNYITHLFFDNDDLSTAREPSYIYLHRRYQEFFFAQKLKAKFEKDPAILRKTRVLANHDFFETLFLPYLRTEYRKENNLVGFLGLNLIEVYLGNNESWGADPAFYRSSKQFIEALAVQNSYSFEQIVNDENLEIREKTFVQIPPLSQAFKNYKSGKHSYRDDSYLREIWEDAVARLVRLNAELHKNDKYAFRNDLDQNLEEVRSIFREQKFLEKYTKRRHDHLEDPFWKEWESYMYHRLIVKRADLKSFYSKYILDHYKKMKDPDFEIGEEQGKTKLIKGFLRVCLGYKRTELLEIIPSFDEYQFCSLLEVLTEIEHLPLFFEDSELHKLINTVITQPPFELTQFNPAFIFFKKILKIDIPDTEIAAAKGLFKELEERRDIDMRFNRVPYRAAISGYIFDHYSFELFLKENKNESFRFYNELGIFCTLYRDYVNMLTGEKKLEQICGDFNRYIDFYSKGLNGKYIVRDLTLLWAHTFTYSVADIDTKRSLAAITVKDENNILPLEFYLAVKRIKKDLYFDLVTERDLDTFEKKLLVSEDFFQDYIDGCFEMSIMLSGVNEKKSLGYFIKGINDGILRHGWRKDYIVSVLLIDAFEIILRNRWDTAKQLKKYAEEVFDLTIRVRNITDGKGTHRGPYTLVETIALYDTVLAEALQAKLSEKLRGYNNGTTATIIKAKISLGLPFDEVEEELGKFKMDYNHEHKPEPDYYLEKFKVYLEVAGNLFYSDTDRENAFQNAYQQVAEVNRQKYSFVDFPNILKDELEQYAILCDKYGKAYNIPERKDDSKYVAKEYSPQNESDFLKSLSGISTKKKLVDAYSRLERYENNIQLTSFDSWKKMVEKTYEITNTMAPLTDFLKKNSYPHIDYITTNAKYCHFAVAAALNNMNTRKQMIEYLSEYSGHGGFANLMKAYEVLKDKEMCLQLFERFLKFCQLLVD